MFLQQAEECVCQHSAKKEREGMQAYDRVPHSMGLCRSALQILSLYFSAFRMCLCCLSSEPVQGSL